MRIVLISVAATLGVAASVLVIVERISPAGGPDQRALRAIEKRLGQLEKILTEAPATPEFHPAPTPEPDSDSPATQKPNPVTPNASADRLSEIKNLIEEAQGMIFDMERGVRRDLNRVYERLLERMDAIGEAGVGESQNAAARQAVFEKLRELGVDVQEDQKQLIVKGEMGNPNRVLELVACAPGGRLHESLLVTHVTPSALKVGIEMLGVPEVEFDRETGKWPEGAQGVYIYVYWKDLKKPRRLETMLWNNDKRDTMRHTPFMFTASYMETDRQTWERFFVADVYKHVISLTLKYAAQAVLCCPLPEAAVEHYWVPFEFNPEPGTPVNIYFCLEPNAEWDKLR